MRIDLASKMVTVFKWRSVLVFSILSVETHETIIYRRGDIMIPQACMRICKVLSSSQMVYCTDAHEALCFHNYYAYR